MGVFNDSTVYEGYDRIYSIGCGYGWSDWRNAMVVLRSGNIGIGTSTPNYLLEVNGTIKAIARATTARVFHCFRAFLQKNTPMANNVTNPVRLPV